MIAGETGIDFVAGPTEIVIIAAEGDAKWIAADMLAQAEHDVDASAILLTTSRELAAAVSVELERQLDVLPTANVARVSIDNNGAIVIIDSMERAVEFSNTLAPEHLALHDPALLDSIQNAGSVFLGPSSPEAAGDYASGPNHVLPTSGQARLRGGLSAADFVKVVSVQELTQDALAGLRSSITTLARAEGLEAHARSVEARFHDRRIAAARSCARDGTVFAADRWSRGKATARFQREHCWMLAQSFGSDPGISHGGSPFDYPEYVEAMAELAAYFHVNQNEFTMTNGTDEAIQILINTFVDDGDDVLVLRPSYAMYRFYAEVAGALVREIDYRKEDLAFRSRSSWMRCGPRPKRY